MPETWEKQLSGGADKKAVFEGLMAEGKLGGLAFLRNLRLMQSVSVDRVLIESYFEKANFSRVLPFRFIAAGRFAPQLEPQLEAAMYKALRNHKNLEGRTLIVVDVSGSMKDTLSAKSDMTRLDAAIGVAILARELCEKVDVITFSDKVTALPARRGFALRDAIAALLGGGTQIDQVTHYVDRNSEQYDRTIILTDEQSNSFFRNSKCFGKLYMVNVAPYRQGIGYGDFVRINGFSKAVLDYIQEYEHAENK